MGRHNRRAAHIHVKIWDGDHCLLTTQLFVPGNPYLDSDYVEGAVSDDLLIDMKPGVSGDADEYEARSEEHTSEIQSLMRISYAVFCLKKKKTLQIIYTTMA